MLTFEQLQDLVAQVTRPGAESAFYRRAYGLLPGAPEIRLRSPQEWEALPIITKDQLIASPLFERSHVPLRELDHLRTSSGTSGKPPLFSPRTHVRNLEYRLAYHDFTGAFMAYTVPLMPHWHERFQKEHGVPPQVVVYDPRTPEASARLARIAGITGLSLFVYHVQSAGEALKREGVAKHIRLLEITGELCTRALYAYMRDTFPNATILQSYNSSEVEDAHLGMPCKPIDGSEPLAVYHPKSTHYLELVDPDTGTVVEPRAGAEGDLLVSAYPGEPASLPLVRFRIGDTVRVVEDACAHGTWSFTVLGRTDMDFLKVAGGILRADEIARVLQLFPDRVSDRFSLHTKETLTERGPLLSPILAVEVRGNPDLQALAQDIAAQLRTGPTMTWQRGVEEGRYLPLTCVPLADTEKNQKRRRIISN